ncbi:uncharacterized protein LOC135480767 [Liolophura sinensis]|uniref:uncharacterized protein LOC135480767 n=1 Tax=Liolophura sinensis TaxID=3198878 RepID=UPI0031594FD8
MAFFSKLYASEGVHEGSHQSPPDYGFDSIDTNKDGLVTVDEEWAGALSIDSNGDSRISEYEYIVSFADSPVSYREAAPMLFRKFDADHNGFLERSDIVTGFKLIDTIGDGAVTKFQYSTFVKKVYDSFNLTGTPGVITSVTSRPKDMSDFGFHRIDVDNNGQITFEEGWNAISLNDVDGDSRININELRASLPKGLYGFAPEMLVKFDAEANGFLERMDIRRLFDLVDTNGDGTLSSPEFSSYVGTYLTNLGVDIHNPNYLVVQMAGPSLCSSILTVLVSLVVSVLYISA